MASTVDESDPLDAAAVQAKRVLRENKARADKLKNVLFILQGKQDAAKSRSKSLRDKRRSCEIGPTLWLPLQLDFWVTFGRGTLT